MPKRIRQLVRDEIEEHGSEWVDEQFVRLGDSSGLVLTDVPGVLSARLYNGKVIPIHNTANVPPTFNLHLKVGRSKSLPTIWQIIEVLEDYLTPAAAGQVAYHHTQHEFDGGDRVWVNRKQVLYLTALVSDAATFIVQVIGGIIRTGNTHVKVENQTFDVSSYVVTAGAVFVSIESDENGSLIAHVGTTFGSKEIAAAADIPIPVEGHYTIAAVLMYDGQAELSDDDIFIPYPVERGGVGAQIFSAATRKVLYDQDLIGYYGTQEGRLRNISFSDFKDNIKGIAERFYAIILNKLNLYLLIGAAAGGDLSGTYPNPEVAKIRGVEVDSGLAPADGDTLVYDLALGKYIDGAGGGGGGVAGFITTDDLTPQIPAAGDHFDLVDEADSDIMLFYNTTYQSPDTYTIDGDGLGLTTDFSPMAGDILVAIYISATGGGGGGGGVDLGQIYALIG